MAFEEYQVKSTLYQYASEAGFRGIVESKEIWFSDLRSVNDPRELIFGQGMAREVLDDVLEAAGSDANILSLQKLSPSIHQTIKNTDYFTCCFSPKGDERPMWLDYGDGGTGLSIGFRPRAITDMPGRVQKVKYIDPENEDHSFVPLIRNHVKSYLENSKKDAVVSSINFSSSLIAECTSTKHTSWEYEQEIRCTYSQTKDQGSTGFMDQVTALAGSGQVQKWVEPKLRKRGDMNMKYLSYPFGKRSAKGIDPSQAIETVIIGPKSALSENEIKDFLLSEGYKKFNIIRSNCAWN